MMRTLLSFLPILFFAAAVWAQDPKPIELPKPDTTGGKPLMQVLKSRHSTREFAPDTIALPVLSNLLWAACGINRADVSKRTAPSAMNWQEVDVYVTSAKGVFLYDAVKHALVPISSDDIREKTGSQPFVKDAAVNLVFVADYAKMTRGSEENKKPFAYADAAFIAENAYLFCASEGLAVVVRASVDGEALAPLLKLRTDQKVIMAQSIGYPKK